MYVRSKEGTEGGEDASFIKVCPFIPFSFSAIYGWLPVSSLIITNYFEKYGIGEGSRTVYLHHSPTQQ